MNKVAMTKEVCYILDTMTLAQVYDYMADIIAFMRREAADFKALAAMNSQYFLSCLKKAEEFVDSHQSLMPPEEFTADMLPQLLALLMHLDQKMEEVREQIWWEIDLDFYDYKD